MRPTRASRLMQDSAQALVEYALILALASAGVVIVLLIFQDSIGTTFQGTSRRLDAATAATGLPPESGSAGGTETGAGAGETVAAPPPATEEH